MYEPQFVLLVTDKISDHLDPKADVKVSGTGFNLDPRQAEVEHRESKYDA